jgi:hypothetical protein
VGMGDGRSGQLLFELMVFSVNEQS